MKYNLLSLMTPISLIGIAFLVYSLGTSIVFISFNQQLQLSYLIALICFMPIGFMLIPHTLSLKYGLYSKETDVFSSNGDFYVRGVSISICHL